MNQKIIVISTQPGILADAIGWYAPYYFYGCMGVCWYMLWLWLAFEKPAKHPSISPREQMYIEKSIGAGPGKNTPTIMTTPWAKVQYSVRSISTLLGHLLLK